MTMAKCCYVSRFPEENEEEMTLQRRDNGKMLGMMISDTVSKTKQLMVQSITPRATQMRKLLTRGLARRIQTTSWMLFGSIWLYHVIPLVGNGMMDLQEAEEIYFKAVKRIHGIPVGVSWKIVRLLTNPEFHP